MNYGGYDYHERAMRMIYKRLTAAFVIVSNIFRCVLWVCFFLSAWKIRPLVWMQEKTNIPPKTFIHSQQMNGGSRHRRRRRKQSTWNAITDVYLCEPASGVPLSSCQYIFAQFSRLNGDTSSPNFQKKDKVKVFSSFIGGWRLPLRRLLSFVCGLRWPNIFISFFVSSLFPQTANDVPISSDTLLIFLFHSFVRIVDSIRHFAVELEGKEIFHREFSRISPVDILCWCLYSRENCPLAREFSTTIDFTLCFNLL